MALVSGTQRKIEREGGKEREDGIAKWYRER